MRLTIENLEQSYGNRTVLRDVNFSAESGEVVTLLGPNGTGKSTLIKTLCRIMQPKNGRICIDGRDVSSISKEEYAKIVGYVPQSSMYFGYSTVYDAVLLGRKPYVQWSYARNDIDKAAEAMVEMGVDNLFDRMVNELSGGQKQRVTIARAIAQDPDIFVFDEPTSALDLRHQLDTFKLMRSIIKRKNALMIIALHDLNLALRYSDKVVVLNDGGVYDFGDVDEVITEEMIHNVYGVESNIVETEKGRFINAYDSEIDSMMHATGDEDDGASLGGQ